MFCVKEHFIKFGNTSFFFVMEISLLSICVYRLEIVQQQKDNHVSLNPWVYYCVNNDKK